MADPGTNEPAPLRATAPEEKIREWTYYYALYHFVAHWAAFNGTFGLLVTLGVVINTSTSGTPTMAVRIYCVLAILGLVLSSWFFLWRMHTYNEIMNKELNPTLIAELARKGARPNILRAAAFCVFGVAAYALIVFNFFR